MPQASIDPVVMAAATVLRLQTSVAHTGPASASEDFGSFGMQWQVPSVFWFVGGADSEIYAKAEREGRLNELPTNHNPKFAPVIHPTLQTGVEALVVATCAWLAR